MNDLEEIQNERRREFEAQKAEAAKCYSDEFINKLAKAFDIGPDKIGVMSEILRFSAWLYKDLKSDKDDRPRAAPMRMEIQELKNAALELKEKLAKLSKATAELYWFPFSQLSSMIFRGPAPLDFDKTEKTLDWDKTKGVNPDYITIQRELDELEHASVGPFGLKIIRHRIDEKTEQVRFLNEYQLIEAVDVLGNLATYALEKIGRDKTGPVPGEALRMWVVNMQNLFVKILGRDFTHNPHKDEETIADSFCQQAIKPLDPSVTDSALGNAMRKVIKLSGQVQRPKSRLATRKDTRSKS